MVGGAQCWLEGATKYGVPCGSVGHRRDCEQGIEAGCTAPHSPACPAASKEKNVRGEWMRAAFKSSGPAPRGTTRPGKTKRTERGSRKAGERAARGEPIVVRSLPPLPPPPTHKTKLRPPTSSSSSWANSPPMVGGVSGSASLQRAAAQRGRRSGGRAQWAAVRPPRRASRGQPSHGVPAGRARAARAAGAAAAPLTQHISAGGGVYERHGLRHAVAVEVAPAELDQVAAARVHTIVRHCTLSQSGGAGEAWKPGQGCWPGTRRTPRGAGGV